MKADEYAVFIALLTEGQLLNGFGVEFAEILFSQFINLIKSGLDLLWFSGLKRVQILIVNYIDNQIIPYLR